MKTMKLREILDIMNDERTVFIHDGETGSYYRAGEVSCKLAENIVTEISVYENILYIEIDAEL